MFVEKNLNQPKGLTRTMKKVEKMLIQYPISQAAAVCQTRAENEELREDLSEVTAQHSSVLEENQRLRAKLENLEQVLKVLLDLDTLLFSFPAPCAP